MVEKANQKKGGTYYLVLLHWNLLTKILGGKL
jgi:hypothetical protein